MLTGAYRKTWPDRDALVFALTYLRQFAANPDDRESPPAGDGRRQAAATAGA